LGEQDSPRKARPCSQTPGAWAGAVVHVVDALGVCTLLSQEKWTRTKAIILKWLDIVQSGEVELCHADLISDRGFLVYATRTYPAMIPYLKGFHLTAEMWRGNRDAEGYRLKEESGDDATVDSGSTLGSTEDADRVRHHLPWNERGDTKHAPATGTTQAVPRLEADLKALKILTNFDLPPLRVVRPFHSVHVYYGFGDASGRQFGSTKSGSFRPSAKGDEGVDLASQTRYRVGLWGADTQEESSNYKEFRNLVDVVEEEAQDGRLSNCEFFLCTDSATAESCFYRGSSRSPLLHDLVIRLRRLEMEFGMIVWLIHVAGSRMIAQGTDGCSRGSFIEGVMAGDDMLSHLELDRSAVDRSSLLMKWIKEWTGRAHLKPLSPEGWFEEGHGVSGGKKDASGVWIPAHVSAGNLFLWAPPPAVADAALEQLLIATHKRTDLFHVVVIPRLMRPLWRRLFHKACDFVFKVVPTHSFWPASMHEPLWVGIILPFTHHRPWRFKRAPLLVEVGISLRRMLASGESDGGDILRELLSLPRKIHSMSECLARKVLLLPVQGVSDAPRGGSRRESMAQRRQED
jgi:hypothetical protein